MIFDFGDTGNIGPLSSGDFVVFRDLISDKTGIKIRDNRVDYLEYRVKERMLVNSVSDYQEYYYKLKYDSEGPESELQELINLITVHETSFFRHAEQLETLQNIVMKRIIKDKGKIYDLRLKIWSAVCATGEEPLTLAMIIKEHFPELSKWVVSITASDISTRALEKAKEAVFNENSFRAPLEYYKNKYFRRTEGKYGRYAAIDEIKNMVTYRNLNLNDIDSLDICKGMDIILCRNVFIYFPEEVKYKISEKFYELLNSGGALILGNAEIIDVRKIPFKLEFHRGGPVYLKA